MMQKKSFPIAPLVTMIAILLIYTSCNIEEPTPMDLAAASLIPKPVSLTATGSSFELTADAAIYVQEGSQELLKIGQYLASRLRPATGFPLEVRPSEKIPASGNIHLSLSNEIKEAEEEAYELSITEKGIKLTAMQVVGLFRGIQTICQLFPARIEENTIQSGPWKIATGTILDYPDYAYRSAMLDVSRHFFPVEDVKRFIDLLAYYKMNNLHLHLSDDQGWRIEIKSWPNLTTHGGSTEVGGGKGGFYTQEEYAEIVQYAQDRFINIVPEIDMPGHTNAALASYPELNCNGKTPELYTGTKVGFSTLCTDKEIVYQFVDDVIRELAALTPGPYIHIGGDESHVTAKDDYIQFINRVQNIVHAHGKLVMGWDEVAEASLESSSIAHYWAVADNAQKAVQQGAKVLMSPAHKAYMDMQYDSTTHLGLHWAAYIEIDSAYIWDLESMVEGIGKENIIGIEAPLWTETITNMDELEYMVFPRLPGYAEIGWTATPDRNWDEYKVRLGKQKDRFEAMGINFYASKFVPWESTENEVIDNKNN